MLPPIGGAALALVHGLLAVSYAMSGQWFLATTNVLAAVTWCGYTILTTTE